MKKFIKVSLIILSVIFLGIFGLLVQAGLFYKVQVKEDVTGPFTVVYTEHKGDYAKAVREGNTVYQVLVAEYGITPVKGFGIYYDDPKKVPKEKLRSEIGCIIEPSDYGKTKIITKFKVRTLEAKKSLVAYHPFTNPFSVILGMSKVYPEFAKKPGSYNYSMEIYDISSKTAVYMMR